MGVENKSGCMEMVQRLTQSSRCSGLGGSSRDKKKSVKFETYFGGRINALGLIDWRWGEMKARVDAGDPQVSTLGGWCSQ